MQEIRLIEVKEEILSDNKEEARKIRERLQSTKTMLVNLMSSPGSGKTSLILRTVERLQRMWRLGVIEADIDSVVDAQKVAARGVPAVQLRTGGFCHLDAAMVDKGIAALDVGAAKGEHRALGSRAKLQRSGLDDVQAGVGVRAGER